MVNEDVERNSNGEKGVEMESEALNNGSVIEIMVNEDLERNGNFEKVVEMESEALNNGSVIEITANENIKRKVNCEKGVEMESEALNNGSVIEIMANEDVERNSNCEKDVEMESETLNNGSVIETDNGVGGEGNSAHSSGNPVEKFTYRRRKRVKMNSDSAEKLPISWNSDSQVTDKVSSFFDLLQSTKEPHLRSSCKQDVRMDSHTSTNVSHECSVKDWPKVVLEQMYQSLSETEGGLQDCIRDALVFNHERSCTSSIKEFRLGERMFSGAYNGYKDQVGATSNGSTNESSSHLESDMWKQALFSVLISTKFAELCELLCGNFHGMNVSSLFNLGLINSRINEGAYKNSPMLFHSDIQQVWTKLRKVGTEIVTVAMSLSETSRASCHNTFHMQETNGLSKVDQREGCCNRTCTCRHCEGKTGGRDCIVCETCKDIYHVSCIEPVQEASRKSWHCAKCRSNGIGSRHEFCVICESIYALRSSCTGVNGLATNGKGVVESYDDLEQDGLLNDDASLPCCKICKIDIGVEDFRTCGHPFCPNKYYHTRCLTVQQLNSYGNCWYCPSCLCRGCLTDRDDDKIVLCDGCDQAFHIYCMQPPRISIPKGKWFCTICDEEIQRIRKAKRAYTNSECKIIKKSEKGNGTYGNGPVGVSKEMEGEVDTSGGMDMLLTAAKTLNSED
ncbi:PHD finger protein EHD3-like [Apium graveolens]|uniref:PHD finger protein EHD3-like n=1 Tax=Apium graveolens TaxID=4045 RepID=UPI003D7B1007